MLMALICMLSACQTVQRTAKPVSGTDAVRAPKATEPPAVVPPAPIDAPNYAQSDVPPCPAPEEKAKTTVKKHAKPVAKAVQETPHSAIAAVKPAFEPIVKPVGDISVSILGKGVRGPQGENLGRVVDVLADEQGRVRIAIIESGGFLGVGNRRIAVDWSLFKIQSRDQGSSLILDVDRRQLQSTPEYKETGGGRFALMADPVAASAGTAASKPAAETQK